MDRLRAMELFLEIAERGSLTAAAQARQLSLPTVVRGLAALERELGVRLFHRTTRTLSITEEGRLYRQHALAIRAAIDESHQAIGRAQAEPTGAVTLTASVKFGEMYVAPLLAGLLERYPRLELQLLLLDRVVNLVEEGVDIAVRIAPLPDSSLVARHVADIRQVIVASPKLLEKLRRPKTPADLAGLPCIRAPGIGEPGVWEFGAGPRRQRVRVGGALSCNSIGGALAACIAGCGLGRFLHYQTLPAVARGELVVLLERFEPKPRPLSLVYPKNRLSSVRVSAVVEALAEGIRATLR